MKSFLSCLASKQRHERERKREKERENRKRERAKDRAKSNAVLDLLFAAPLVPKCILDAHFGYFGMSPELLDRSIAGSLDLLNSDCLYMFMKVWQKL